MARQRRRRRETTEEDLYSEEEEMEKIEQEEQEKKEEEEQEEDADDANPDGAIEDGVSDDLEALGDGDAAIDVVDICFSYFFKGCIYYIKKRFVLLLECPAVVMTCMHTACSTS